MNVNSKNMNYDGIILILSCERHKETRLKKYGPSKETYKNWKVIKVIGNLFMQEDYILEDNILYIKCEDSYIHLLKKLALSIKYLYQIFNIKHGILRCGDDLIFNEQKLIEFLERPKWDFYGQAHSKTIDYMSTDLNLLKQVKYDNFMLDYYKNHLNELSDPKHGIHMTLDELKMYLIRPNIWGPTGIIYYLSTHACNILIETMKTIDYNVFYKDEFTNSYPYTIEDVAVTFMMYYNKIPFINKRIFWDAPDSIVKHTNDNR